MSHRPASRATWTGVMLTLAVLLGGARVASAQCGGTQLCAPGGPGVDCTVGADCTITVPAGGLTIDLRPRRVVITKTLTIAGPGGAGLTINAGSFLINGGTIVAPGAADVAGSVALLATTDVTVQNNALIDVSAGLAAGLVDIEALGGNIAFAGRIKANGTTRGSFGGDVTLFATGNANVSGSTLDVSGGDQGAAASVSIDALTGSVVVDVPIKASGADGGDIEIAAGTTLQTSSATSMNVGATGDAGSGGSIDLSAAGDLTVGGESTGTGSPAASSEDQQSGGDGADVDVFSQNGTVAINGKIEVSGAAAGLGGTIDIDAGLNLTVSRPMVSQGVGIDGGAGDILLSAGGTMTLPQQIDVRGGTGSGGSIDAAAAGNVTVSSSLLADGDLVGGAIFLTGCAVNITSSALLSAQGPGGAPLGSNSVEARSTLTVRGTLRASAENELVYRGPTAPSTTGAVIQPPATIRLDPTLPCCVSCPATTTTTTTTSTTTTTIATTTTTTTTLPTTTTTVPTTTTTTIPTTTTTVPTTTTTVPTTTTTTTTSTTSTTTTTTSTTSTTTLATTTTTTSTTTTTTLAVCGAVPRSSCKRPVEEGKAQLKLKDSAKGADKDQLTWKWDAGEATTLAEFGDPLATDAIALCVYDRSQPTPVLLFRAAVPPGGDCGTATKPKACWTTSKGKTFKFASKTGNADGVTKVGLTAGTDGKTKIQLKGKGLGLTGRPFGLPVPPLPLPLTVQLQSGNGQCWQADLSAQGVKKNAGELFEAKGE